MNEWVIHLRVKLGALYAREIDARRACSDAGLPLGEIEFGGAAQNTWYSALTVAAAHPGGVEALVAVALKSFGDDPELAELARTRPAEPAATTADRVAAASGGISQVRQVLRTVPAAAEAVSLSREVLENSYRQVARLELFKNLHDELHVVEFECLRPLEAGGALSGMLVYKLSLESAVRRLQKALAGVASPPLIGDELLERLSDTKGRFAAAIASPTAENRDLVIDDLNVLLVGFPPRLEVGIAEAAGEVSFQKLVELMSQVRRRVIDAGPISALEDKSLIEGIDAVATLQRELDQRVLEHRCLQRLDSRLRMVCVSDTPPRDLPTEWQRIKRVADELAAHRCSEVLISQLEDLGKKAVEIEASLAPSPKPESMALLREYFRAVSTVFRFIDAELKDFCGRLGEVAAALRKMLEGLAADDAFGQPPRSSHG